MGLFSFGKKDGAPSRRGVKAGSTRGARTEPSTGTSSGSRVERRTRRTERAGAGNPPRGLPSTEGSPRGTGRGTSFDQRRDGADAPLLDPTLPEKQRARRRLVGAIALVIAAVVVLPMVLDSHSKPVTDDIAIDIPTRPAHAAETSSDDTQAGVAPDNPAPDTTVAASALVPVKPKTAVAADAAKPAAKQPTADASPAPAAKPAKPQTPAAPASATRAKPAQPAAQTATRTKPAEPAAQSAARPMPAAPSTADADSGTPASPPGARFAVQLGSFSDEASAHTWASKLKAAGVPAYTEHRKQADGSFRTLLRAGPFADRAAASEAIAKVREAGLTASAGNGSGSTQ
jgi:DedD protein